MSPVISTAVLFKAFADVLTSQGLRNEEKTILKGWEMKLAVLGIQGNKNWSSELAKEEPR